MKLNPGSPVKYLFSTSKSILLVVPQTMKMSIYCRNSSIFVEGVIWAFSLVALHPDEGIERGLTSEKMLLILVHEWR